jgi:hypothetical protein
MGSGNAETTKPAAELTAKGAIIGTIGILAGLGLAYWAYATGISVFGLALFVLGLLVFLLGLSQFNLL